jgi:hypothetical protein
MHSDPSSTELEQVAQQTLASFERRRAFWFFQNQQLADWFKAVANFRIFVRKLDPSTFNESDFVEVEATLGRVADFLEKHQTTQVSQDDSTQWVFLGDSIRELRDAKSWILQGYSADPSKRPTDEERRVAAASHAAKTLSKLFA